MPESEPKPKLIELMGGGAGQGWKAVLKNGKPAVVHEIPVPQAEATAAVPRLQRLFEHRHPALSPVLAWGTDANGIWVAVEPNEGTPLSSILTRGPMTPGAAAALGSAVLSGVAALHETGIAMGGFGATAVRVNANGEVRLAGHPAAAVRGAPSQSDLRADVRSSGMAVCASFGVDPAGAPAPANIPPGLVVTMRSMASGAMGPSADRALGALREMAAPLLAPDRQMAAQSELATRAGGREIPPITPFLPAGTVAPGQPSPTAPAPFIAPPRRDEPATRGSLYEAPDRPVQTYPSIPAITVPPAPAAPAAAAPAASAAVETPPSTPAIPTWGGEATPKAPEAPTWSEAPPRTPPTAEPAPSSLFATNPPAPAPVEEPVAPLEPSPAPAFATNPPAPVAPPAPIPAASPAPAAQTWTPVESPVWKPGEVVPAEPLGTGYAIDIPKIEPEPVAAAPVAPATPASPAAPPWQPVSPGSGASPAMARETVPPAPARKPAVPRPRAPRGLDPSERPGWLVPAAIAAVVVILLGAVGVIILPRLGAGNPIASVTATPSGHATTSPKTTPSSTGGPQAVPTYAPASAAPISKVQICTAAAPCNIPGGSPETGSPCDLSSCKVEVALYFTSVQKSVPVSYIIKVFDRCTGQTTDLPGAKTTTPSTGFIVAIPTDHLSVALPGGLKSAAIVAVAQQPAEAASPPLLIGSETC
jgi:hypothetical protein